MSTTNTPKTWQQGGEDTQDPVPGSLLMDANTVLYGGRLVWSRIDTGYATDSVYAAANPSNVRCWGKATATIDNTTTNTVGNPGTSGTVSVPFNQGVFLLNNAGDIVAGTLGMPVYLVTDVYSSNSSLPTVSANPTNGSGTFRPFVGYITAPDIYPNVNPDALKISVRVGRNPGNAPIAGTQQQIQSNDPNVYTAAFTTAPGYMHKINPSGATFAFTFPAITSKIDGMRISVINISTGSTATVAAPTGSDNIGNSAGASTGATAAGPTGGVVKTYTADNTQKAWLVGL
jgi:hypothetical protein